MIMSEKIKIEIVSDVVCPWCIIGYKRLEKAIEELGVKDKVEIKWQPFQLNPTMSPEGKNALEYMSNKYNMSIDEVRTYQDDRVKTGMELGFKFDYFDEMKTVNTLDAHILLEYAKEFEKQTELALRFFSAHFKERKDVSKREVLAQEIKNVGLDAADTMKYLDSQAREELKTKAAYWRDSGITAVPTMVFNGSMRMNGAYPIGTYKEVISELLEKGDK